MPTDKKLSILRNRIDSLDTRMLDLLKRRAEVVGEVARVKGRQSIYIRPGREAKMLRALLKKPRGKVPAVLIHRLWREMIGAFTLQEGGLKVAVTVPKGAEGLWDLTRDHFGSFTPLQPIASSKAALRALIRRKVKIAVVPLPSSQGEIWWRTLIGQPDLKIFYRFPFDGSVGNARPHGGGGLVIGRLAPEKTGKDISLLAVEWKKSAKTSAIAKALRALPGAAGHLSRREAGKPAISLVKLKGFILADDKRLKNWLGRHKDIILKHRVIGAYPAPIS